jgi:hypothetical protein
MNDELKNEILTSYEEAKSVWSAWVAEAKEDWKFKMSDQWSEIDKTTMRNKQLPMLSINHIFKNINLLSGYQRQNRGEIKVYPIEGGDEMKAEVLNMVIKWILTDRNVNFTVSDAFKDSLICGLSWLHPYRTFDDDPINGDIIVKKISPFDILPDPHFTERNLSDCDYIIRHRKVSKNKLKRLYPSYAEDIQAMQGSSAENDFTENTQVPSDKGNHILVIEYWYRVYEKQTMIFNTQDPEDSEVWDGSRGELKEFLAANPDITKIENTIPRMKLATLIGDKILIDGYTPYGGGDYPFIPIFSFYESSYSDWKIKLHGMVRPLKDLQREKNKRRSNIMAAINTMPHSGWIMDQNAVDDKAVLAQSAGAGKIIVKNPGKTLEAIRPPDVPMSLIQMETMFDNDIQVVGNNPDMLGQMSDKGAPGVVLQLRQRQGLTSVQELFDSLSEAQRTLGRRLIDMIVRNFSTQKIKRIIGDDFIFTKQIKELQANLKALQKQVPIVPDIPMEVTPEDESIYQVASDGARQVMEEQKMQERDTMQEHAVQKQIYAVRQQAALIENEIGNLQKEEEQFWIDFEKVKETARFDVTIDETIESKTYRASTLMMLTQMKQYGMPVTNEMMLDYMELPKSSKERYLRDMAVMQQQMMAQEQAQQQPPQQQMQGGMQ